MSTTQERISFARELQLTTGDKSDWAYFARWHYRGHDLGLVRTIRVLWHGDDPIGICVFTMPPASLAGRHRYFGGSTRPSRVKLQALNHQLAMLARVVLHPSYRGAGIAADFVRASCESCPWPWIETLAEMANWNPFFERAGFQRVDTPKRSRKKRSQKSHSGVYASGRTVSRETFEKSRFSQPVYLIRQRQRECEGTWRDAPTEGIDPC